MNTEGSLKHSSTGLPQTPALISKEVFLTGYQEAENRQLLAAAYTGLKENQRELILLRYGQELTLREISSVTGLPLRTVQTNLRRAVKKMRAVLDP